LAVLCSIKGVSTILVFWNGSEKNPAAIAPLEDRIFIQAFKKDQFPTQEQFTPVGRDFIRLHHDAYGASRRPRSITRELTMRSSRKHPSSGTSTTAAG